MATVPRVNGGIPEFGRYVDCPKVVPPCERGYTIVGVTERAVGDGSPWERGYAF